MIRKPATDPRREHGAVTRLRTVATGGVAVARAGGDYVRGMVCWGFAGLWGFAALASGASMAGLPTVVGIGALSVLMAWAGARRFARARDRHRAHALR